MFNLDHAISEWRRRMLAEGLTTRAILDELESHLRDDVETQVRQGATEQQAFESAVQHMGQAGAIEAEFAKAEGIGRQRSRRSLRLVCLGCALLMLISGCLLFRSETSALDRLLGFSLVSLAAMYTGSLPSWYGRQSLRRKAAVGKALGIAGILATLGSLLALVGGFPAMHFQVGSTFHLVLWPLCGAVAVTIFTEVFYGVHAATGGLSPFPSLEAFTPVAQRSLKLAQAEACGFHHDFVGTEHALLGLLALEEGITGQVLRRIGLDRETVRTKINEQVRLGTEQRAAQTLRCTPRLRKALRLATREAKTFNHGQVGAGHILVGLLLEGDGVAARVLKELGVDAELARRALAKA